VRRSENERVGILPPGPINNDDLLEKDAHGVMRIREGLVVNRDYRGVNKDVWMIFQRMYGGGPMIVRAELDIYSKDMSNELSGKRKKESSNIFASAKQQ
jgi:hypothetical protein